MERRTPSGVQGDPEPDPAARAPAGTRVLVVDDHRTFSELLTLALATEPEFACVEHASTAAEATAAVARLRPHLVIMDVELPDLDGLSLTARLTAEDRELRVVVVTAHTDPQFVGRAAAAGACGFVPKNGSLDDMLRALRTARLGHMVVPPQLVASMTDSGVTPRRRALPGLTPRERQVLELMGQGLHVGAIARRLGISLHTCRGYVKNVLAKLGAHSQLEAVITASQLGLVQVPAHGARS